METSTKQTLKHSNLTVQDGSKRSGLSKHNTTYISHKLKKGKKFKKAKRVRIRSRPLKDSVRKNKSGAKAKRQVAMEEEIPRLPTEQERDKIIEPSDIYVGGGRKKLLFLTLRGRSTI